SWANPEFGQILASCSMDRTVSIWEEFEDKKGEKIWQRKAVFTDSKEPIQDVKFSPKQFGLKVAACSLDGLVRIYEAPDLSNLSEWNTLESIEYQKGGVECISWNPSILDEKPQLVIGNSDSNIKLFQ